MNIGSIAGKVGFNELSAYASSKSSLLGLTKSLTSEFSMKKIRFNIVNPGLSKHHTLKNLKKEKSYTVGPCQNSNEKWGILRIYLNFLCL